MEALLPDTRMARAYKEAERRKAEAEEAARASAAAAAALFFAEHVYDVRPYADAAPADPRMYEGTGIGGLYGLPGSEWVAAELGDWRLVNVRTGS